MSKARPLRDAHVNSTYYGGGVAEMLLSLSLPMNNLGVAHRLADHPGAARLLRRHSASSKAAAVSPMPGIESDSSRCRSSVGLLPTNSGVRHA